MSATSRSGALSARASRDADGTKPAASSLRFSFFKLKNSLRCIGDVPIFTRLKSLTT